MCLRLLNIVFEVYNIYVYSENECEMGQNNYDF